MQDMSNCVFSCMKKVFFFSLFIWVVGCSSNKVVNEPVELQLFKPDVLVKQLWVTSPREGVGDQFLQLTPFIFDDDLYAVSTQGTVSVYIGLPVSLFGKKYCINRCLRAWGEIKSNSTYQTTMANLLHLIAQMVM